jgi:hypothetical protein
MSFLSLKPIILSQPHSPLVGFNGAKDNTLPGVFQKTIKKDKGEEFTFGGFRSLPHIDAKVSPLHVIFDLKGVFIGKEYFKINHLMPPPFNFAWDHTLLGKSVVPKPTLKEFFLRCLK